MGSGFLQCLLPAYAIICFIICYFNSFLRHGVFLEVGNSFVSQIKGKFYLYTKNMGEKTINEKNW